MTTDPTDPSTPADSSAVLSTDPSIHAAEEAQLGEREAKAISLFDLRKVIAGVFLVYGVVLVILGIVGSHEDKTKAAGININLWVGLAMLVLGLLFVAWSLWRPLLSAEEEKAGRGSGRLRRAPS
jgi:hypothetical protein